MQPTDRITPQQLESIVGSYQEILRNPATSQETLLTALAAVKAAHAAYESVPTAVYPLGAFTIRSGQIVVVDAFITAENAVLVPSVMNGAWQAFVGVEAGVHVALFAYHEKVMPTQTTTVHDLVRQPHWTQIGTVLIDTATCAIADREAYAPLVAGESGYHLAGVAAHLCFSNSANADGGYPVFRQMEGSFVTAVAVQFAPLT
jgi:hypothetical protein